jgi:hypothetical protein
MRVVHTGITADSFLIQVTGTRQSITWSVFESEVMGVWKPVTDTGYLSAACTPVPFVTDLRQSEYADPFWYFNPATSNADLGLRSFAGTNQRIRTVGCTP